MKQLIVLAALFVLGLADPEMKLRIKNIRGFGDSREEMWRMFHGQQTVEEKLMFDLMKNYNKFVKPTGTTNLRFSLSFICSHLDTRDQMINTRAIEKYEWTDMRLKWNPTDHSNIRKIRIPAFKIWTPDMKLMNSHKTTEERDMTANVVITNDGTVMFMPMVTYKTHCMKDQETLTRRNIMERHTGGTTGTHKGIQEEIHQGTHGKYGGVRGGMHGGVHTRVGGDLMEELLGENVGGRIKSSESSSSSSSEEMNLRHGNMLTCKLVLGSWSYDDKQLHLTLQGQGLDKTYYSDMCPSDITDLKVRIKDNVFPEAPEEKYPTMIVDFKLKERRN